MDKDLQKLITETVDKIFQSAPMKMVEQGTRPEYYDICPHCKEEIYERHEYTEDGGTTWRHSGCGGLIDRKEEPLDTFVEWLRPGIEEARDQKKAARKALGINEVWRHKLADLNPKEIEIVAKYMPAYKENAKNTYGDYDKNTDLDSYLIQKILDDPENVRNNVLRQAHSPEPTDTAKPEKPSEKPSKLEDPESSSEPRIISIKRGAGGVGYTDYDTITGNITMEIPLSIEPPKHIKHTFTPVEFEKTFYNSGGDYWYTTLIKLGYPFEKFDLNVPVRFYPLLTKSNLREKIIKKENKQKSPISKNLIEISQKHWYKNHSKNITDALGSKVLNQLKESKSLPTDDQINRAVVKAYLIDKNKRSGLNNKSGDDIDGKLPIGGEKKYSKQEPGGTMSAVNLD